MSDQDAVVSPKVFISYSWTTPDHERWVLDLANRLVEVDGIDVVLDKWELAAGHDKYKFMERMVSDKTISRVLLICDKAYAEKADGRRGGVGDETQIVTSKVYGETDQNRFIPVIAERDENGKEYLPIYLAPRMYVDLSNTDTYESEHERLTRIIYNQPEHVKPKLGKAPAFVTEPPGTARPTSHKLRSFKNALQTSKPHASGLANDYLREVNTALQSGEVFVKQGVTSQTKDLIEQIKASIDAFLPYRDEFVEYVDLVCQYGTRGDRMFDAIQRFFFDASPLMFVDYKEGGKSLPDTYQFLIGELFLYTIATMLRHDRYQELAKLLGASYPSSAEGRRGAMESFRVFSQPMRHISDWIRPTFGYGDPGTDTKWLIERAKNKIVDLADLTDADFVLLMRDVLSRASDGFYWQWYPSLVTADRHTMRYYQNGFSSFAKAASRDEFKDLCLLLAVQNKVNLVDRLNAAFAGTENGRAKHIAGIDRETIERYMRLQQLDSR